MSNLRSTIEALASQFASSVLEALRSASIDELVDVAGSSGGARRGPGRPRASASAPSPEAESGPRRRGRGGRLGRRSAGDITRMIESIVGALQKASAGLRAEQIRETLGVEAKELPRPLAEAISTGRITKSGQKRATTYFAAGGGGAAPKRRGRKPAAKAKKR
ncbi:MAG TPA: hypothetical protein VLT33_30645 [Labilithrix sp.]|nr:hypothetical protein [Labilithrix sp.]